MSTYTPLSIKKALCQKYLAGDCDLGDRCKGAHPASTTAGNSATSMPDPGEMDVDYAHSLTGPQNTLPPRPVLEPQSTNEAQIATEAQPIAEAEIESDDGSDNESIPDTGIPWDAMTGAPVDMTKFDAADEDF